MDHIPPDPAFQTALQHHQGGRIDQAEQFYRQILARDPNHADALHLLGVAAHQTGRNNEAVKLISRAVALRPNWPEALSNLSVALTEIGKFDEAIDACNCAVALAPSHAEAQYNLGNALRASGQVDQAIAAYRRAIALRPGYAQAHGNLGSALLANGRIDDAVAAYRQEIVLSPNSAEAHNNLGNALKDTGQLDQAIAAYRTAIDLRPGYRKAESNLLFALHYHPNVDARAILEAHRSWARRTAGEDTGGTQVRSHTNHRDPDRRLRVGYVSPDFRGHVVGNFLLPLLVHHDKATVEIFAYAHVAAPDEMTRRLRQHVDVWRDIARLSDAQAVELIRRDQIDILVDLALHSGGNRLSIFAAKPAPLQVTYLGYCSTTGLEAIDYRLSDPYLDLPEGDDTVYSEKTIRLPKTYWCYEPPAGTGDPGELPARARGYVTFGCLNNFSKVSEPALSAWSRILGMVPGSRLLLHAHAGSHRRRVLDRFAREGIDPDRLRFAGFLPALQYFGLYREVDVALDTFPYAGGTTTCDALWMGVPVVSLIGRTAAGRGGFSILSNVGLPDLACRSEDQYVRVATELAGDLARLGQLRATLRKRMEQSPLMDGRRFARDVEAAYRQIWRAWCIRHIA